MFCGGSIIFGYRVVNKRVEINEDEANIVRYIFDQYAHGRQAKDILNELTAQGIGRRNKPFPINTFYSILHNPKYIGVANLSDGAYTNIYPPIIPKELFEKVQMILEKNKRGSRSKDTDYLLTRNVICANGQHKILKAAELNVDQSRNPISDYGFPINLFFIINFTINICFYLQ